MQNYKHVVPTRDWGKSMTLPDQNYTVKQLFERFSRGLPVQGAKQNPIYLGEENDVDIEKVNNMSIMDKADLSDEMRQRAEELEQLYNDTQAERSEAQKKLEEEKARQAEAAEPPKEAKA